MEIKPDTLSLTLSEARWAVRQPHLPEDFRRIIEQRRREVLASVVSVDVATAPELTKDMESEGEGPAYQGMLWAYVTAQGEMHKAEADYPRDANGNEQHVVEVARSEGITNLLYEWASSNYSLLRGQVTTSVDDMYSDMVHRDIPVTLTSEEEDSLAAEDFSEKLEEMQVVSGIVDAIVRAKAQDQ